ncbi:solute carrier family 5 (sodium-dependent multivitamin transporter), member 6, partial [Paragonimus westermani]
MHLHWFLQYLEYRFGKCVRWIASLIFCLQMWVYISLALYAPSLAFSQDVSSNVHFVYKMLGGISAHQFLVPFPKIVVGLPIWLSLISTGLVTTFYTALGGIRAVMWTDVFQLLILTAGMCVVVTFGIIKAGGPQRVWTIALENKRLQSFSFSPDPFLRHSVWSLAIGGASLVLSTFSANQTLVQRYLS